MSYITHQTKNIILASNAGFCYGVKRAVETTKKLKAENPDKEICVLGELIHNSQVIKELSDLGIKTIETLPESGCGYCVVRSKGFELIDLTCPDVKKVQDKAIELVKDGYFLIILGKGEHPEVMAIRANAARNTDDDNVFVAQNLEELKEIEDTIKKKVKVGIVVQTTQRAEFLQEIVAYLAPIVKELKIANTICRSTTLRQNEAREVAKKSDLMIVVGSKKSANTTHLAEILVDITKTIHIENADELKNYKNEIQHARNIGITAGASTPDYIINEVIDSVK